jgi:hypothetical protein
MKRSWPPPLKQHIARTLEQAARGAHAPCGSAERMAAIGALIMLAWRLAGENKRKGC